MLLRDSVTTLYCNLLLFYFLLKIFSRQRHSKSKNIHVHYLLSFRKHLCIYFIHGYQTFNLVATDNKTHRRI